MDKKRLKIALAVWMLLEVHFLKQMNLLIVLLNEECEREKITADEVIFLLLNLQKKKKLASIIKKEKRLSKEIITFNDHRWSCRI